MIMSYYVHPLCPSPKSIYPSPQNIYMYIYIEGGERKAGREMMNMDTPELGDAVPTIKTKLLAPNTHCLIQRSREKWPVYALSSFPWLLIHHIVLNSGLRDWLTAILGVPFKSSRVT